MALGWIQLVTEISSRGIPCVCKKRVSRVLRADNFANFLEP